MKLRALSERKTRGAVAPVKEVGTGGALRRRRGER
jgi:hypothetical protein